MSIKVRRWTWFILLIVAVGVMVASIFNINALEWLTRHPYAGMTIKAIVFFVVIGLATLYYRRKLRNL